jgi:hypothetical protein
VSFADNIKKTQSAFPSEESRAVEGCPEEEEEIVEEQPEQAPVAAQAIEPVEEKPVRPKKTWVKIALVDMQGKPIPNERYRITLPGSTQPVEGTLDNRGEAAHYDIDPGTCHITFPDLDMEAWEHVSST